MKLPCLKSPTGRAHVPVNEQLFNTQAPKGPGILLPNPSREGIGWSFTFTVLKSAFITKFIDAHFSFNLYNTLLKGLNKLKWLFSHSDGIILTQTARAQLSVRPCTSASSKTLSPWPSTPNSALTLHEAILHKSPALSGI